MSLSLSSLLNPEPAHRAPDASPPARRESLQPVESVASPDHHALPSSLAALRQQYHSYSPQITQEAAHALAALSASSAPPPTLYHAYAPLYAHSEQVRSAETRPGSGHGAPMELPPPTSPAGDASKLSSPTLDQYHIASRSPNLRRPSLISPAQSIFTLPPLQSTGAAQADAPRPVSSGAPSDATKINPCAAEVRNDAPLPSPLAAREAPTARQGARASTLPHYSPPAPLVASTASLSGQIDGPSSSPVAVKLESVATSEASSPVDSKRSFALPNMDPSTWRAVASLKNEHGLRTHSPLRESSVVPSTETPPSEQVSVPKKRPASTRKKGTATARKAPPAKKRKVEPKRSVTPSSRPSKPAGPKTGSSKGTPANSSPAPTNPSDSADPNDEPYDDDEGLDDADIDPDADVYCICRKPDNGTFMIGCDGTCDDWFHGKCVGIDERDKNLIDKYICPHCAKAGVGQTTWKRMCRRQGCRQPARVGKGKSKYCSEECGVAFFRDLVARSRGREGAGTHRAHKRKSSLTSCERPAVGPNDDLGARGGVLSASEVKSLLDRSKTIDKFKKLGEGVLSPPATPDGKDAGGCGHHDSRTEQDTIALRLIGEQKEAARRRHQLLKDRMKFVTMTKQAATRAAAEKELKPKEYCGYDPRLEWREEEFAAWRDSRTGTQAFELETLAVENGSRSGGGGDIMMKDGQAPTDQNAVDQEEAELAVCSRRKCPRHLEWSKLAVDDLRFEMRDNSDRMRALEREEKEIREQSAMRAGRKRLGGDGEEGAVEVHGLGISVD